MQILIIGAGGHGQVVADALLAAAEAGEDLRPVGFLDDNASRHGHSYLGLPVLGPLSCLSTLTHDAVVVAIGENAVRARLYGQLEQSGERFVVARHPSARIGRDVTIGPGTVLFAGVVINTGSRIGANVIINTGTTVDHHNTIGDHSHLAPGVHTGGEVTIGKAVLVGIGATVMPRCRVGDEAIVGAGAVVTRDVPPGMTVVGIPARELRPCAR